MTAGNEEYPAGWLTRFRRGFVAGVTLLVVAVVLSAVPTFLAWFAPGADSTSAGSALRAAVLIALLGNHGGFVLDGTAVTLTPLLVTILLGWLVAQRARRQDSTSGFAGLVAGYGTACAVAASWAQIGATRAPILATAVAATVFAGLVGSVARGWSSRWGQLGPRWRRVLRAAAAGALVYLTAGAALAATALAAHLHQAADLQSRLATGAGGLPVTLIGIGASPNAVLSSVGYLAGPGFSLGSHTSVSMFTLHRGTLPAFPMLAALPSGAPATSLGVILGVLTALVAGWCANRLISEGRPADERPARLVDLALAGAGAGAGLALLCTIAAGSLGPAALRHVGSSGWQVGGAATTLLAASGALWLAVDWVRAAARSVSTPSISAPSASATSASPVSSSSAAPAAAPPVGLKVLSSDAAGVDAEAGPDAADTPLRSTG